MSLRLRLVLVIGIALALLWSVAALVMLRHLDRNIQQTLDERLVMSSRMVSGLLAQSPLDLNAVPELAAQGAAASSAGRGIACQIRSLRGEVIATQGTSATPLGIDGEGYGIKEVDGSLWRTYTLRSDRFSITTADRIEERESLRNRIAFAAGLPFLIAALGGLLALWIGAGRGLAPLERLRGTLIHRQPDAVEPLDVHGLPRELQPLIQSLNRLLHRNAQTVLRERQFTNNAAHELRTPLTAIDTHLQVARISTGKDAEQAIADAGEGARRMRSTLDQLLMLARIEGRLPFDQDELITADQAISRALAGISGPGVGRVVCRGDGAAVLAVPPALAVAALRNLIDNALRYSPPEQAVEVLTETDVGIVRFRVVDHGPGLLPGEHEQAMQRFWRARGTQSGSGLGLAIVDAIATRYGGHVGLKQNEGNGICAELVLPRS